MSKLRYDKIVCATDADDDGYHIFCLLTMILAQLTPEIIKQGKYFLAQTPLFAVTGGKKFIPLWTDKELEKARKKNQTISRFKGLGELSPWQLKICAIDEETRRFIPVQYSENIDKLMKLFSDANERRKLLNDKF